MEMQIRQYIGVLESKGPDGRDSVFMNKGSYINTELSNYYYRRKVQTSFQGILTHLKMIMKLTMMNILLMKAEF